MIEQEQLDLEKKYLNKVLKEINSQKKICVNELTLLAKEKKDFSLHFSEDFYSMDDEEALSEGDILNRLEIAENQSRERFERLKRQEISPYFGRVDFKEKSGKKINSYYVGINNLVATNKEIPLICDWRAPVSSLFYDYEMGEAYYDAPEKRINGQIFLKRQYEIKDKELVGAFDSSLTIGDDILKSVLNKSSTKKMKTIVSTIQKEQNKIIRNVNSKNILVQGVAGSGKTSIALHRVAFLLYQNKNTLKAEDILILSPNTIFSAYISEVLPELGEENMSQMSYYRLACQQLSGMGVKIERKENAINDAILNKDRLNQVAYKHTFEFFESLKSFCESYFAINFKPKDLKFGKDIITSNELLKLYNETYKTKSPAVRVEWIVDYIIEKLNITTAIEEISARLKRIIYPFFEEGNMLKIYADFLANIGMEFSLNDVGEVRYEDVGSILYIANYLFGLNKNKEVKYLIIDEMQDYSFVDMYVLGIIFDCNKTVLGDINQCIDKVMTKDDLEKLKEMLNAELIVLNKAYRSTYEISEYASKIKNIDCEKFERHGEVPQTIDVNDKNFEDVVSDIISKNEFSSYAILTKTIAEAEEIYFKLSNIEGVTLNTSTDEHIGGVCVMPTYLAKGLEFDVVIVPNFLKNNNNYLENNLLYISCTRALHKLFLLNNKK